MHTHIPMTPFRLTFIPFALLLFCLPALGQTPEQLMRTEHAVTQAQNAQQARPDYPIRPMALAIKDRSLSAGDTIDIEFVVFEFQNLTSYQFILGFDTAWLQFEALEVDPGLPITNGNFGLFTIDIGELPSVFAGINGVTVTNGTVLFRLSLVVLKNAPRLSEHLFLETSQIPAEAYDAFLISKPIELRFTGDLSERKAPTEAVLQLSCYPNPFTHHGWMQLNMPAPGPAYITVFTFEGQIWNTWTRNLAAGIQELPLPESLPAGGFILRVETPFGTKSQIMQKN